MVRRERLLTLCGETAQARGKPHPMKALVQRWSGGGEEKSLVQEAEADERALPVGIYFGCPGPEGIHSPACLCSAPGVFSYPAHSPGPHLSLAGLSAAIGVMPQQCPPPAPTAQPFPPMRPAEPDPPRGPCSSLDQPRPSPQGGARCLQLGLPQCCPICWLWSGGWDGPCPPARALTDTHGNPPTAHQTQGSPDSDEPPPPIDMPELTYL